MRSASSSRQTSHKGSKGTPHAERDSHPRRGARHAGRSPGGRIRARPGIEALLLLLLINLVLPQATISAGARALLAHVLGIALIGVVSWVLVSVAAAFRDALHSRYPLDAAENLKACAVHTQLNVLMKIVVVVILVIAGGSALMRFEKVRQVGVSILASAGIAGVIIGFAALRSIATIFAGFQIALTQPILLDDVVVVEGEWGRIEEITLTYVVVRIWDLRCLVREKLIGWLQKNHPESLPRLRAEVLPAANERGSGRLREG